MAYTIAASNEIKNVTEVVRAGRKQDFRKKSDGTLNSSIWSAATYAKENKVSMFVYMGNSYMNAVARVTYNKSDALCTINNTGGAFYEVTADLSVIKHEVVR